MCGIVGYIGNKFVDSVLIVGLERLEYRGYDSAGIGTISGTELLIRKKKGRLRLLDENLKQKPLGGSIGIGHTRWATHGEPSDENAHPHTDCKGEIAVVHNGIIENYQALKEKLISQGHIFTSETDTEVIPHLIEQNYTENILQAVIETVKELNGAFALCIISTKEPDKIIAVRQGSPLIISFGKEENFIASDIPAVMLHSRSVVYLKDSWIGIVYKDKVDIVDFQGKPVEYKIEQIGWETVQLDKGDYEYFMLKEIFEQPNIAEEILRKRLKGDNVILFDELSLDKKYLASVKRIIIQACGTSWHAGLVSEFWLEKYANIHTEVDVSSEYRYRNPLLEGDTLMIAISQSGETADTLAGIREAKSKFIKVLSVVNVTKSTIARESDSIIPIFAGPEVGVASTKAYTAQLISLLLFSLYLGYLNYTISEKEIKNILTELTKLPYLVRKTLNTHTLVKDYADKFYQSRDFLFISRGINYPNALEGALKLKEISYIHSTGYPAGEFKHGPIALVNENTPVVCIVPQGELYDKMLSNIKEVLARKGIIVAISTEGDEQIPQLTQYVIPIPRCSEVISPILTVIPLQLLAYYIAVKLGCDVDKPRNLAKSVTVE